MKLLEFPHSHYCEKARWALDYKGIPFQPVTVMPGFHVITMRSYGPKTCVPVLMHSNNKKEAVQGSSEIINYLEENYPSYPLTPTNADERKECLAIEHSVDKGLGENIRQILYNELLAYPDFIRYGFTHPMPQTKQLIFRLFYPMLRNMIYKTYVISAAKVEEAKFDFDDAMTEIEKKLKGRQYLIGDKFTRADLSVASMLSLLVKPSEHPFPWNELPDPKSTSFHDMYNDHPVSQWVRNIYRDHRLVDSHSRSIIQ